MGIAHQIDDKNLQYIMDVLLTAHSTQAKYFLQVIEEIHQNMAEAKSNIEFLQIVKKPCERLNDVEDPSQIPPKLVEILNLYRYIWLNSSHYNTPERITNLCRALSNQIILQCSEFIDFALVFEKKRSREAIKMFQTCIDCCTNYIRIYVGVAEAHTERSPVPWNLKISSIFNQIDTFLQRCRDMIEICEAMIVFGRHDETQDIPKPLLGGSRGLEFESWNEKIESMFRESLSKLEQVKFFLERAIPLINNSKCVSS